MGKRFNKAKLKAVLHFVVAATADAEVYKTHLFKILYFADFNFYEKHYELLTGEVYAKLERGPAPRHFDEVAGELEKEGLIQREAVNFPTGYSGERFVALKEPNYKFSADELAEIKYAIEKCAKMTANEVSEYSHGDTPWHVAKPNESLDPGYVFYRLPEYAVTEDEDE